jgi:hypothetical protein
MGKAKDKMGKRNGTDAAIITLEKKEKVRKGVMDGRREGKANRGFGGGLNWMGTKGQWGDMPSSGMCHATMSLPPSPIAFLM